MEVICNKKGNEVEYTETISGCDICSVTNVSNKRTPRKARERPPHLAAHLHGPDGTNHASIERIIPVRQDNSQMTTRA